MKKIIGLAAVLCCLSSQAFAYTFTRVGQSVPPPPFDPPPATQSIALEATGSFPGDSISIGIDPPLAVGDRVVLTARSVEDAVEAAEALKGEGLPAVHPAQLDVSDEDSVQAFFGFLQAEFDANDDWLSSHG